MEILLSLAHFGITGAFDSDLEQDTAVMITGNKTVDKCDGSAPAIGVVTAKRNMENNGTFDVFAKHKATVKIQTAVTAGQSFKFGAVDGTTGENRIAPWVAGTDDVSLRAGIVWQGGAADAEAEVFIQ